MDSKTVHELHAYIFTLVDRQFQGGKKPSSQAYYNALIEVKTEIFGIFRDVIDALD